MKIVRSVVEDHVALVSSVISVVLIMERLVHVADEAHDVLQGLGLRRPICLAVSQDGEKLLGFAYDAITVGTFLREVNLRICQRDVNVVPGAGLTVVAPMLVGPVRYAVDRDGSQMMSLILAGFSS